jgi:hypothetical protein
MTNARIIVKAIIRGNLADEHWSSTEHNSVWQHVDWHSLSLRHEAERGFKISSVSMCT